MGEENRKGAPEEPGAFQKVLGALNQGQKIRALEIARKHGIPDDDPVWHVVLTIAEAEEGIKEIAQSLREASVKVTEATSAEVKASRELAAREIVKMQEAAKANIANALGSTLENEIRNAVGRLQSQSNRPLHKKWLIAMAVGILLAAGLGSWETHSVYKRIDKRTRAAYERGVNSGIGMAVPATKTFHDFMDCTIPGGVITHSPDGNEFFCTLGPDPQTGKPYKVRIR